MLKDFIYLFLIDLCRIPINHDYASYVKTEPGYGASMLAAYITAFNSKQDGVISEDLIKSIHKVAMQFSLKSEAGRYKTSHNHYKISPSIMEDVRGSSIYENLQYGVTEKGIDEFLNYWVIGNAKPIPSLVFEHRADALNQPAYIIKYGIDGFYMGFGIPNKKEWKKTPLSTKKAKEMIHSLLKKVEYGCEVNLMIDESESDLPKLVSKKMQDIIASYEKDIKNSSSINEKITTIVTCVQRINQLHPFFDGNIRTCYILLNKLLRDHGLSLSLLMNPNRLDLCSVSELVAMVKQGQAHYQQLLQHTKGDLTLKAPDELFFKEISCGPQSLIDIPDPLIAEFIENIPKNKKKRFDEERTKDTRMLLYDVNKSLTAKTSNLSASNDLTLFKPTALLVDKNVIDSSFSYSCSDSITLDY